LPSSIIKCRVMGEEWGIIWHKKVSILKNGMPVPVGFLFLEMPCQCLHNIMWPANTLKFSSWCFTRF
jgi:hypothetical protein